MCLTAVLFVNLSVCHRIVKRNRADVPAEMIQVAIIIVIVCISLFTVILSLTFYKVLDLCSYFLSLTISTITEAEQSCAFLSSFNTDI